jgi:hypothetical protein
MNVGCLQWKMFIPNFMKIGPLNRFHYVEIFADKQTYGHTHMYINIITYPWFA